MEIFLSEYLSTYIGMYVSLPPMIRMRLIVILFSSTHLHLCISLAKGLMSSFILPFAQRA